MRFDELKKIFEERPFRPVRVFFTRGKPLDVRHPEQVIIMRSMFFYAVSRSKNGPLERTGYQSLVHIVKVEYLSALRRRKARNKRTA